LICSKTDDAQIIPGWPTLGTAGCHIDVRKGRVTFEVQGRYVVFCYMKEKVVSPNSSLLDKFLLSLEINMEDVLNCEDPHDFNWISIEDPDQRYVKVEFIAPMLPSIPKGAPYRRI